VVPLPLWLRQAIFLVCADRQVAVNSKKLANKKMDFMTVAGFSKKLWLEFIKNRSVNLQFSANVPQFKAVF
jgi:hypothetical protein